jgi:hypothetical protein
MEMVFFYISVPSGLFVDVFNEFFGSKIFPTGFAPMESMDTDDFITDGNSPDSIFISHPYGLRGADVYTGCTAYAVPFHRYDIAQPSPFLHFEGLCLYDLFAHADA